MLRALMILCLGVLSITADVLAQDNVSVTVNGRVYQCSGGGGGPSPINLCRCRRELYSGADYDYYLEKYAQSSGTYTALQAFRESVQDNGEGDRQACESARQDPACYFASPLFEAITAQAAHSAALESSGK